MHIIIFYHDNSKITLDSVKRLKKKSPRAVSLMKLFSSAAVLYCIGTYAWVVKCYPNTMYVTMIQNLRNPDFQISEFEQGIKHSLNKRKDKLR